MEGLPNDVWRNAGDETLRWCWRGVTVDEAASGSSDDMTGVLADASGLNALNPDKVDEPAGDAIGELTSGEPAERMRNELCPDESKLGLRALRGDPAVPST